MKGKVVKKPETLDRESQDYKDFLKGVSILGATARDMGELTGKPQELIEAMARGMSRTEDADRDDLCLLIVMLMWEMAHRERETVGK